MHILQVAIHTDATSYYLFPKDEWYLNIETRYACKAAIWKAHSTAHEGKDAEKRGTENKTYVNLRFVKFEESSRALNSNLMCGVWVGGRRN